MSASWLHSAWGKFRNYENLLEEKLTRTELGGAYMIWEYLLDMGSENSSDAGHLLDSLSEEQRAGALVYSSWFAANAKSVKASWGDSLSDQSQASDSVSVELS
tara:strand:- start:556 stop:864 length:309 start_codon:yes stop_codon:yes gene_type:complete